MNSNLYNKDYEECLLGCMILDNSCIDAVQSKIKPEYFFYETYRKVYTAILELCNSHHVVDFISLSNLCKEVPVSTIAALTNNVSTASTFEYYTEQITNLYLSRSVYNLCKNAVQSMNGQNITEVLGLMDSEITKCLNGTSESTKETTKTIVEKFIKEVEDASKKTDKYLGYETGFEQLDDMMDGLPKGTLITLGARPSIGKSAFAAQMMFNMAEKKIPCAMFSLEMSNMSQIYRRVSAETGIKSYFLKHGMVTKSMSQLNKIQSCIGKIYDSDVYLFDTQNGSRNLNWILTTIRALSKVGVKVFFIDHIGLISHPNKSLKRYEQIGDMTMQFHDLSQKLGTTIIELCQLKRESEGKKPSLADLRESGDIEQNSDTCMFLHRNRAQGNEISIPTELIVAKNRDGGCGTLNFNFYPSTTKFEEVKVQNPMEHKSAT